MKNKKLITYKISKELNLSVNDSKKITDAFVLILKDVLKKQNVKLSAFGTFFRHRTPKRIGRNPKTKESYIISPRVKVNFRASRKAKEVLNWIWILGN